MSDLPSFENALQFMKRGNVSSSHFKIMQSLLKTQVEKLENQQHTEKIHDMNKK